MEFPSALYRGPSGHSAAGFPRHGIIVKSSGNPISLSHSRGISLRTRIRDRATTTPPSRSKSVPSPPPPRSRLGIVETTSVSRSLPLRFPWSRL